MVNKMRKTCVLFLVLMLVLQVFQASVSGYSFNSKEGKSKLYNSVVLFVGSPKTYVKNQVKWIDTINDRIVPIKQKDSILIPAGFIARGFGAKVNWDGKTKTVLLNYAGKKISFKVNDYNMTIGTKKVKITTPAKMINGNTYIPLNDFAKAVERSYYMDSRGLIVVGDRYDQLDPIIDRELLDSLVNEFKSYRGNNVGNLTHNYPAVVEAGGWLYYSNWNNKDVSKLSKMKADGTEATIIADDKAYCISVMGDWIYYINFSDNDTVYRVKIDGTGRARISDDKAFNVTVLGDHVYYSVYNGIYKMDLDGYNKKKVISDNISNLNYMNVVGEWIYYVDSKLGYIRKVKTDGTQKTILRKKHSRELNVVAGNIYFTDYSSTANKRKIYKMDVYGRYETKLVDKVTSDLIVTQNNLYFKNAGGKDSKYRIYKTDLLGKNLKQISSDTTGEAFAVMGSWLYYNESVYKNGSVHYYMRRIKADGTMKQDLEHIIPELPIK